MKKKKPLAKKKNLKKKMTDKRRTYLKREVKQKFGNELSAFLPELSNYELEKLLTEYINPNTLKKYSWFFKGIEQYTDKNGKRRERKWLKYQYAPYKNRNEEYIYKIFKGRKPDDAALSSVLNKGKRQWRKWKNEVESKAEALAIKTSTNPNPKILDCILFLVNYKQQGASVNDVKIAASIYTNETDYLNFKVVDTGKSYVNDKFINWADFEGLGYWKMTIQKKNQYSGINLLGLFSDLTDEERKDRRVELKKKLFDDGKISKPTTYNYRKQNRTQGQLGREEVEYALEKGYIELADILTPGEKRQTVHHILQ